jgi:membrane protein DedA with SNARE-associated domain
MLEDLLVNHGPYFAYAGIVIFLILTGGGLPIPEEVPIIIAGVASAGDSPLLNVWVAFACCVVGALLGDLLVYGIGRYLGNGFFRQHPRFAHFLHEEREKQMEDLIQRHGLKVFLLARFMVGVRAPVYLAAGVLRVSFKRFIIVDAFCATLVVSVVFSLSYFFGHDIANFIRGGQWGVTAVVVVAVLIGGLIFYRRHRKAKAAKLAAERAAIEKPQEGESQCEKSRVVA